MAGVGSGRVEQAGPRGGGGGRHGGPDLRLRAGLPGSNSVAPSLLLLLLLLLRLLAFFLFAIICLGVCSLCEFYFFPVWPLRSRWLSGLMPGM